MAQTSSMSGRYYRTCMDDIRSSEGWFGKICLLGLISFVPVFGQMTVSGYAYEWAHKAAWGLQDPMPKKIYGRPGSKMLRWGWFVLVITFLFALIPGIISMIGSFMNAAGTPDVVYTSRGLRSSGVANPALVAAGGFFSLAGSILTVFTYVFAWVACIRMTVYDRLGTGLQLGKVWKMAKHDFGGLMRILGMSLIWGLIFALIASIICVIIVAIAVVPAVAVGVSTSSGGSGAFAYVLAAIAVAAPLFLIFAYALFVAQSFLNILIARAVGYWARQFDIPSWGTKDDPLPFETQATQQATYATPQQPQQQPYAQEQPVSQQPAQVQEGAYAQAQPVQSVPEQPVEQAVAEQPQLAQAAQHESQPAQAEAQPTTEQPQAAETAPHEAQPATEQPQQAQETQQLQSQEGEHQ